MPGRNQAVYHDEIISGELGQIGTQFDGLGHLGMGDLFYNGNRRTEFAQAEGLTKLGIENVGAIVTRGVTIGSQCVIGAAALVNRDVPDRAIAFGTPARVVGHVEVEGDQVRLVYDADSR